MQQILELLGDLFYLLFLTVGVAILCGILLCILKIKVNAAESRADALPDIYEIAKKTTVHILTDEELSQLYTCKPQETNDTCIYLTQEEAELLMKIAVVEDYTSVESQANIMLVILNRVQDPLFPDNVKDVIYQKWKGKYQFAVVSNGTLETAEPDVNSHLALAMIEKGEISSEALYFEAEWAKNTWQSRNLEYVGTVGETKFYK